MSSPKVLPAIRSLLLSSPQVAALVGDRILTSPEPGTQLPAIFVARVGGAPTQQIQQGDPRRTVRLQVDVVCGNSGAPEHRPDYATRDALSGAIEDFLIACSVRCPDVVLSDQTVRIPRLSVIDSRDFISPDTLNPRTVFIVSADLEVVDG